jgi:hypothetical protein
MRHSASLFAQPSAARLLGPTSVVQPVIFDLRESVFRATPPPVKFRSRWGFHRSAAVHWLAPSLRTTHSTPLMAGSAVQAAAAAAPAEDPFATAVASKQPYYAKRIQLFEQYAARTRAAVETAKAEAVGIIVTMPDGKQRSATKGVTTPMDIAKEVSSSLAKKVVVADVDGMPWDLLRPLEGDCALKLFGFDDPEGKDVSNRCWCGC